MASPQVFRVEIDLSQRVKAFPGMYGLVIGNFEKGKVGERMFITSTMEADLRIGKPNVGSDHAYYILHSFLLKSRRCWVVRVARNPLYGGVFVGASFWKGLGIGDGVKTDFSGIVEFGRFIPGTLSIYVDDKKVAYDDELGNVDGYGVSGTCNSFTGEVNISFDEPVPPEAVVYAVWGFEPIPFVDGMEDVDSYEFDKGRIIELPLNIQSGECDDVLVPFPLVDPTGSVGDPSQATVTIEDEDGIIAYANDTGIFVDVRGNALDSSFSNQVNYPDGRINFKFDSGFTPNGMVIAKYRSYLSDLMVIAGESPGAWTDDYSIAINEINYKEDTFKISVYEKTKDGYYYAVMRDNYSKSYKLDGFDRQLFIEERMNDKNYYIRSKLNPYLEFVTNKGAIFPSETREHNDILYTFKSVQLAGGSRGLAPSVADYINALQQFKNKEEVKVDIIIDTLGDPTYQLEMYKICDHYIGGRGDCYFVAYVPPELEDHTDYKTQIVNYRRYTLNISSSYGGLYTPHVLIEDRYNDRQIYIPPSGFVASVFSYTADISEPWFPAAGWRRGILPVRDVKIRYSLGDRDFLYDNDVNCLRHKPGRGVSVWGQKTLYGRASALDRANVRWLLIVVENAIEDFLEDYEFELIDEYTMALARGTVWNYLNSIKRRRGLYDFEVVCEMDVNNTPETIDNYELYLDYSVQPTKAGEYIYGRCIITRTGVKFEDIRLVA